MFLLMSLLFSFSLQAQHLDHVCRQAYLPLGGGYYQHNPPVIQDGYLARRTRVQERGMSYVVESLQGKRIYQTPERIYDLVAIDDHLVLLMGFKLSVINLQGQLIREFALNALPYGDSHGRSMVRVDRHFYIARGEAGVSAFSMDEMKMVWDADLRDIEKGGAAEAIVFDGQHLRLVAATTQEFGFTGIVTMDLSGKILQTTPYDTRRSGVIGVGARARWFNDSLFINNLGWVHIFNRSQLAQTRSVRPRWLAHQIGEANNRYHYMMLTGDMILAGDKLLGCGLTYEGAARERVSRLFELNL